MTKLIYIGFILISISVLKSQNLSDKTKSKKVIKSEKLYFTNNAKLPFESNTGCYDTNKFNEYDPHGNLINIFLLMPNDGTELIDSFTFKDNKLEKSKSFNKGQIAIERLYEYSTEKKLIKEIVSDYTNDQSSYLEHTYYENNKEKIQNYYFSKEENKFIASNYYTEIIYDVKKNIKSKKNVSSTDLTEWTYTYSDKNKLIKSVQYIPNIETVYRYNKEGDLAQEIETYFYENEDQIIKEKTFDYVYNKHGDWIKKNEKVIQLQGLKKIYVCNNTIVRKIKYY